MVFTYLSWGWCVYTVRVVRVYVKTFVVWLVGCQLDLSQVKSTFSVIFTRFLIKLQSTLLTFGTITGVMPLNVV